MGVSENNKRIVKNTVLLYIRMCVLMLISLYTSRVILQTLGVEDYGVYNVVGGIVSMFSIITSSLSNAISRFTIYELGKGNTNRLSEVFSTSMIVLLLLSIVAVVLIEVFGGWFLNRGMNIPVERMNSANWVFHCAVVTFVINLLCVPYNASIIAHEKMSAFAFISIIDAVLKLLVVFGLALSPYDKLKTYAVLLVIVSIIIWNIYVGYSRKHFCECRYHISFDKSLFKGMLGFAGWNFIGTTTSVLNTHGLNIVTNLFFGVTVNAARGIATTVYSAGQQLVNSFTTAINPQITKYYAANDLNLMYNLVCRGARISYMLVLLILIPIIGEVDNILHLWLGVVPDDTGVFVNLIMIDLLLNVAGQSMIQAVWSTGRIKSYYLRVTYCTTLVLPVSYALFYIGLPAYIAYLVQIAADILLFVVRMRVFKKELLLPVKKFIIEVVLRMGIVTLLSIIVPILIKSVCKPSVITSVVYVFSSVILTSIICFFIGISQSERVFIIQNIKSRLKWTKVDI